MAGGFWFLVILFSFVQSGRGPGGDKEARGGCSRKQVGQWFGKPSPFVLQARTGPPTAPPAQLFMLAGMTSSPAHRGGCTCFSFTCTTLSRKAGQRRPGLEWPRLCSQARVGLGRATSWDEKAAGPLRPTSQPLDSLLFIL